MRAKFELHRRALFAPSFLCFSLLSSTTSASGTSLIPRQHRKTTKMTSFFPFKNPIPANRLPPRRRLGPTRDDQARPRGRGRSRRLARPVRGAEAGDPVSCVGWLVGRWREEREREERRRIVFRRHRQMRKKENSTLFSFFFSLIINLDVPHLPPKLQRGL